MSYKKSNVSDLKLEKIEFMIKFILKLKEVIYTSKTNDRSRIYNNSEHIGT